MKATGKFSMSSGASRVGERRRVQRGGGGDDADGALRAAERLPPGLRHRAPAAARAFLRPAEQRRAAAPGRRERGGRRRGGRSWYGNGPTGDDALAAGNDADGGDAVRRGRARRALRRHCARRRQLARDGPQRAPAARGARAPPDGRRCVAAHEAHRLVQLGRTPLRAVARRLDPRLTRYTRISIQMIQSRIHEN